MLENFDNEFGITNHSGCHSAANSTMDKNHILRYMLDNQMFAQIASRKHHTFEVEHVHRNLTSTTNKDDLMDLMKKHLYTIRHTFYD